ncbi:MAG: hypothetical protein RR543_06015, partial [Erysipelotrichales bacterium]
VGLYRAIGMTNRQMFGIHAIYGCVIYISSLFTYLTINIYISISRGITVSEVLSTSLKSSNIILFIILGIGFIFAIMLPVNSELKENILDTISKE